MGFAYYDQYSLLHFASGVLAFFWGVSLEVWIVLNIIFEFIENSQNGYKFIKFKIKQWPGSKPYCDSKLNSVTDIIFGIIGYLIAKHLYVHFDKLYTKLDYKHIATLV